MSGPVPAVWVVASHRMLKNPNDHDQRYTLVDEAGQLTVLNEGLQPMTYPRAPLDRVEALLDTVDGILLGGSDTNVHPHLYGEEPHHEGMLFDHERDELAQALIRLAIAKRVPIISFCRGCQDFNVAMGGSLHQCLQDQPGRVKHWEDPDEEIDDQYAERHFVTTVLGGELERITGMHRFPASSLHAQGVKELGQGLVAEAHADDGLVEAFRWHDPSLFAWGFQFHPEWGWRWHPAYHRIMDAYVAACWQHFSARTGAPVPVPQTPHPPQMA
ncbi:gamma-glutamyl-gamma-aminobutyrate hydrolase family protein [Ramlibacter albus]|uniref:Gamma-glutamyl-gamma-aminobutyrate hydrolase family protein n=1 Tax=Ramlibacter albus TaxID=2079448 RepID=A0A923S592_9BURK|nr:gamma-glutamyl-gamma-aminobutyrate hydrolase family protein [Ramlibacter albus]MBC5764932.1 gamma-glutamyl-gamma-aminobutyrate hydrolase family protein [Ramlibacter albus]